ncbi:MAG: peptidoglycan-binding protein [Rhizobiales bacterium]|nr:peptidoglycan-binding protein [Hyphomicrobiales bacterium]
MLPVNLSKIQKRLTELGFDAGPQDGILGPRTEKAIIDFKKSIGLKPRAYIGPRTLSALFDVPAFSSVAPDPLASTGSALPWFAHATQVLGLHEQRDHGALRKWFDKAVSWIDPRQIPWCGAFVATCLRKWNPDIKLPANPLLARAWLGFGVASKPQMGAVMIFSRPPSKLYGHVGFYAGETATHFKIRGGNQKNAVTDTLIAKTRFLGARMPAGYSGTGKRVTVTNNGISTSTNEA